MTKSNYNFPERSDVPTIEYDPGRVTFGEREQKTLFIQYDADEWDYESDLTQTVQTINALFGTDVQVALIDDSIEFLDPDEVRALLPEDTDD